MKSVLVTGSSGFVGEYFTNELFTRGYKVKGLDILAPSLPIPGVEYHRGSILDDMLVIDLLKNVDIVIHCAGIVPITKNNKQFIKVNYQGTVNLFNHCLKSKVYHFTQISSSSVYGLQGSVYKLIDESIEEKPFEPYGFSKLKADKFLLQQIAAQKKISIAILRPRTIVGPKRSGLFHLLFSWAKKNQTMFIIGDGENKMQLIDLRDLFEATLLASTLCKNGVFNIGTDQYSTMNQIIIDLKNSAESKSRLVKLPSKIFKFIFEFLDKINVSPFSAWHYKSCDIDFVFDIRKAKNELGWTPIFSNKKMIEDSYKDFSNSESIGLSPHRQPLKLKLLRIFLK